MGPFVNKIISIINKPKNYEEYLDAVSCAGEIFRKYKMGINSDDFPEINDISFSKEEIFEIKDALILSVEHNPNQQSVGSVFNMLGYLSDKTLKEWFVIHLEKQLLAALYHNLNLHCLEICLSEIGEDIIEGSSQSVGDYEKNIQQARKYFGKQGKKFHA